MAAVFGGRSVAVSGLVTVVSVVAVRPVVVLSIAMVTVSDLPRRQDNSCDRIVFFWISVYFPGEFSNVI